MEKLEPLLLMTVSETVEAANWHELCNILRRHALGCAGSRADLRARLENVFHKARILIGDVAERVERARRFQLAQRLRRVSKAGKALVDSFDLFALVEVMHDEFPALGIRGFWLSLYEGWDKTNPYSRLITARRSAIRVDPPAPGERFLTKQLLPRQLLPESERYALVVEPLYYGRDQLGLCVMEWGAPDEVVYDILREQLSAALEGALLLRRVAEESAQREQAERKQLHHELVLAQRIQQSILPRQLAVKHLEIAAALVSALEVSGDYYDVLPVTGGCFIGFGDVAGHGLRTGLIVLMLQSVIAALAAEGRTESPSAILRVANRVLFENVRRRLGQDEHVTLTLIRYYDDGRLVFAGAHEELLIRRARAGLIQRISTLGTWLAASPDIADVTEDQTLKLDDGDLLVLYTDGVTDAKNAQGERFGIERLCQMIERAPDQNPEWLRDSLLEAVRAWAVAQEDDIALFVARYHPS
jgi:serine phosphatase RsbU (regulator of sigma subunit)